jgi:outer membrane protein assembly factor BamB
MGRNLGGWVALAGLAACRSPTQIDVTVSTDVPCARVSGTSLTSGTLGEIERIPPAATTSSCANEYIGSVVLVPNGDDGALVGFKVVAGLDGQPVDQCAPDDAGSYGSRCIVSRRALRYLPHTPLVVDVRLSGACAGIACDPLSTCVEGTCVPALIGNPAACEGNGCGEGVLTPGGGGAPGDASAADGSPIDATATDSSIPDASPEAATDAVASSDARVDAAVTDASLGDGSVLGCDLGGLQAGAVWPMGGYCPSRRGRSPYPGPTAMPTKMWRYPASDSLPGTVLAAPTVGADGTIYVATAANHVVAVSPTGAFLWDQSIPPDENGFVTEPVLARDGTIRLMVDSTTGNYAVFPLDGGTPITRALKVPGSGPVSSAGGLTIVGGDTMYVCDTDTNLSALTPQGGFAWFVDGVANENIRPAVDPNTGVVFVGNTLGTVTGVAPEGGIAWSVKLDAGASPDIRGLAVAVDGTVRAHTSYGADLVFSFDPKAKDASSAVQWQRAMSDAVNGLAVDDLGTTFVATGQGIVALSASSGTQVGQYAGGACGPPVLDSNANVFAWCSNDVVALTPDLKTVLWSISVPGMATVNDTPVIGAGNVVYFTANGGTLPDGGADNFLVALEP